METKKFILYSNQYGFDMFWADPNKSNVAYLTDTESEAMIYDMNDYKPEILIKQIFDTTGEWLFTVKFI